MSSGFLHHASAVSTLLCFTTGTAPGEPIKIVRKAGDSCYDGSFPPTHASKCHIPDGKNSVEVPRMRWNRGAPMGIKEEQFRGRAVKFSRDYPWTLDEWGVAATGEYIVYGVLE